MTTTCGWLSWANNRASRSSRCHALSFWAISGRINFSAFTSKIEPQDAPDHCHRAFADPLNQLISIEDHLPRFVGQRPTRIIAMRHFVAHERTVSLRLGSSIALGDIVASTWWGFNHAQRRAAVIPRRNRPTRRKIVILVYNGHPAGTRRSTRPSRMSSPVATLQDAGKLDVDLILGSEDVSRQLASGRHPEQRAIRDERPADTKPSKPSIVAEFAIEVDVDAVLFHHVTSGATCRSSARMSSGTSSMGRCTEFRHPSTCRSEQSARTSALEAARRSDIELIETIVACE